MPPTVFRPSLPRMLLMLVGSAVFVVLGPCFLAMGNLVGWVVGAVSMLFFGYCGLVVLYRLVRRLPELVVDDDGLDHVAHGRVSWDDVDHVAARVMVVNGLRHHMVEVVLSDPAVYRPRQFLQPVLARGNRAMGCSPYTIPTNTVRASVRDVVAAMRRHNPDLYVR